MACCARTTRRTTSLLIVGGHRERCVSQSGNHREKGSVERVAVIINASCVDIETPYGSSGLDAERREREKLCADQRGIESLREYLSLLRRRSRFEFRRTYGREVDVWH